MAESTVEQRVRGIILSVLDVKDSDLESAVRFRDLGASSIDFVEILAKIENEFDVDIPDRAAPNLNTVDKIVEYLAPRGDAVSR